MEKLLQGGGFSKSERKGNSTHQKKPSTFLKFLRRLLFSKLDGGRKHRMRSEFSAGFIQKLFFFRGEAVVAAGLDFGQYFIQSFLHGAVFPIACRVAL